MILAFVVSVTAIVLLARLFASMIVFALPLYCAGLSSMYAWQHGLGIPAAVLAAAASAFEPSAATNDSSTDWKRATPLPLFAPNIDLSAARCSACGRTADARRH